PPPGQAPAFGALRVAVLLLIVGALALFFLAPARLLRSERTGGGSGDGDRFPATGARSLFALVFLAFVVLNVVSEAGMARQVTVRYVLPVYLLVPIALAVPLAALAARSRLGAAAALAALALVVAFDGRETY